MTQPAVSTTLGKSQHFNMTLWCAILAWNEHDSHMQQHTTRNLLHEDAADLSRPEGDGYHVAVWQGLEQMPGTSSRVRGTVHHAQPKPCKKNIFDSNRRPPFGFTCHVMLPTVQQASPSLHRKMPDQEECKSLFFARLLGYWEPSAPRSARPARVTETREDGLAVCPGLCRR